MDRMEFISQIVHIFALDHLVHYTTREGQPQPCASVQDPASATGLHAALAAGHSRESSEAAIPERAVFTSSVKTESIPLPYCPSRALTDIWAMHTRGPRASERTSWTLRQANPAPLRDVWTDD
jgi:hypothetical protein